MIRFLLRAESVLTVPFFGLAWFVCAIWFACVAGYKCAALKQSERAAMLKRIADSFRGDPQ